jgi:uncharacterized membrane protein YheB (UPF0754 family)
MVELLLDRTDQLLDTRLADLVARIGGERLQSLCGGVSGQIVALLAADGTKQAMGALLRQHVETLLDQGRRPWAEVVDTLLPEGEQEQVRATLTQELAALLRSPAAATVSRRLIGEMIDHLVSRPVGILDHLMPIGVRRGLSDYIVLLVNRMLLDEVPGLVDSLHIRQLVADKVDSLDLLRLEGLLLSIMEEQFKYINLFGALLGFLIGCLNTLLLHLG